MAVARKGKTTVKGLVSMRDMNGNEVQIGEVAAKHIPIKEKGGIMAKEVTAEPGAAAVPKAEKKPRKSRKNSKIVVLQEVVDHQSEFPVMKPVGDPCVSVAAARDFIKEQGLPGKFLIVCLRETLEVKSVQTVMLIKV